MRTIVNAVLLTVIVTIASASLVMYALAAHHNYKLLDAQWDAQNSCIAHFIQMGIERADITRDGYTCTIKTYHSFPDNE